MKAFTSIFVFLIAQLAVLSSIAQTGTRPKIGLTLSGGGAKGLAHIGILKALDSAGLDVDYVTGTSMGAVVGSLYAAGYSGDSIYQLAKKLNWNALLLSKSPMNSFIMEEKTEYGRYALELPLQDGKLKVPSGILEAEELWLKFDELYQPVYNIQDFDSLPRPFRCIATDISTGSAVVLKKGPLLSAVRASMAIPTVFTQVEYNDSVTLVDGGIIRNFPVRDVKQMGADIIIGSTVDRMTRLKARELTSPVQILMNVAFFREHEYNKLDRDLCTYLIRHPLSGYSTASFSSSDSIIAIGIRIGQLYYPIFKKMADSLNSIYGKPLLRSLPVVPGKITIRHILTDSLVYIQKDYFMRMLDIQEGTAYSLEELQTGIRQAYGTKYFNRLYFRLEPVSPGVADMRVVHKENLPVTAKFTLNYNPMTKIMLIANLSFRDLIGKQSVSAVSIGISENPRLRLNYTKVAGSSKFPLASVTEVYGESQKYPQFRDYKSIGEYRQLSGFFDTRLQLAYNRKLLYAAGARLHVVDIRPRSETIVSFKGNNVYAQPYLRFEFNSLDRAILPRKGLYILLEPSAIVAQRQKNSFSILGVPVGIDTLNIDRNNFLRGRAQMQYVGQVQRRTYMTVQAEAGANFNTEQLQFHDFLLGGLQPIFRNQVTFTGLPDGALSTNSYIKGNLNFRYQLSGNLYTAANANVLYHSFLKQLLPSSTKFVTGFGITLGLDTFFGPFEVTMTYSPEAKTFNTYLNAGFRFSRDSF